MVPAASDLEKIDQIVMLDTELQMKCATYSRQYPAHCRIPIVNLLPDPIILALQRNSKFDAVIRMYRTKHTQLDELLVQHGKESSAQGSPQATVPRTDSWEPSGPYLGPQEQMLGLGQIIG